MTVMEAWQWIFANWGTASWKRIPERVASVLGLRSDLGMVSFTLCTQTGAQGMRRYIAYMNRDRNV